VTEQKLGKKMKYLFGKPSSHSTQLVRETITSTRQAPLAALRDRRCRHDPEAKNMTRFDHTLMIKAVNFFLESSTYFDQDTFAKNAQHWLDNQDVLRSDRIHRVLPRMLWTFAVKIAVLEEFTHGFLSKLLTNSLLTNAMQDVLMRKPRIEDADFIEMMGQPALRNALFTISKGINEAILFMHSAEYKKCDCLAYVATAPEIGVLRTAKPIKEKLEISICAVCEESLAAPKHCSRCGKVAYCGVEHQKQH